MNYYYYYYLRWFIFIVIINNIKKFKNIMLSIWMRFSENLMEWKKYFHYCIQLISMFPLFLILMTKWYRWTLISIASVWKKKGISTRVKLKSQRNRTKLSSRNVCTDSTASKRGMVKVRVWPVSWKLRPATTCLVLFQAVYSIFKNSRAKLAPMSV